MKDNIVDVKEKSEQTINKEESNIEYATNKVNTSITIGTEKGIKLFLDKGQKSVINTKDNISRTKIKIKDLSNKRKIKRKNTNTKKVNKRLKVGNKNIKNIKKAQKVSKESIKAQKRMVEASKQIIKNIKVAIKVVIKTIKGIVLGTKTLIDLIVAGGWIVVVIIVILCVIGMIFGSFFGIFFSNEDDSNNKKMSVVISEINQELSEKIEKVKNENKDNYDDVKINSNMAKWEEILSLYAVLNIEQSDVITLNQDKIDTIRAIFWNMNNITFEIKEEQVDGRVKKILYINVSSKSLIDMISYYNLSKSQKEQLTELLSNEYQGLWDQVIYGSNFGTSNLLFPVGYLYTITQYYSESHKALDIASNYGANIIAVSSGTITTVKGGCRVGDLNCNGKGGNYIILKHYDNKYYSVYMHLKDIKVKVGDEVLAGDIIGTMGNTGNVEPIPIDENSTNGTHLHFVLYLGQPYNGGIPINLNLYFNLK